MWTTNNQAEMKELLTTFSTDSRAIYGDYAYASGFLESMIVQMLPNLPKRVQKDFISDMQRQNLRGQRQRQELAGPGSAEQT